MVLSVRVSLPSGSFPVRTSGGSPPSAARLASICALLDIGPPQRIMCYLCVGVSQMQRHSEWTWCCLCREMPQGLDRVPLCNTDLVLRQSLGNRNMECIWLLCSGRVYRSSPRSDKTVSINLPSTHELLCSFVRLKSLSSTSLNNWSCSMLWGVSGSDTELLWGSSELVTVDGLR